MPKIRGITIKVKENGVRETIERYGGLTEFLFDGFRERYVTGLLKHQGSAALAIVETFHEHARCVRPGTIYFCFPPGEDVQIIFLVMEHLGLEPFSFVKSATYDEGGKRTPVNDYFTHPYIRGYEAIESWDYLTKTLNYPTYENL